MSRLARIVCDNPDCKSQVEWFAGDYFRKYQGTEDTPEGWYRLTYTPEAKTETEYIAAKYSDAAQPRYFCSVECVRHFTGEIKKPENRPEILEQ